RVTLRMPSAGRQEGEGTNMASKTNSQGVAGQSGTVPRTPPSLPSTQASMHESGQGSQDSDGRLIDHIANASEGLHLEREVQGRYGEDPFFQDILKNPKHYKNFEVRDGLVLLRDRGCELLCIPDIRIRERSAREIVITHAHSLLAHLGSTKTLSLLRDHVWWKS
ncbi:hypothetical protein BD413DRAFT_444565, partial [Trametes elegans]